jgi:hypothetical protein
MGLFDRFRIKKEEEPLPDLEKLIRGSSYPRGVEPQPDAVQTVQCRFDTRETLGLMVPAERGQKAAAGFHEMADPRAVEAFLELSRGEEKPGEKKLFRRL